MRPMWVRGVTYSTTQVATLKRWCFFLHKHLCYSLGESNRKVQELFGKLRTMKGAEEKLQEAVSTPVVQEVFKAKGHPEAGKAKRARGASKKRRTDITT